MTGLFRPWVRKRSGLSALVAPMRGVVSMRMARGSAGEHTTRGPRLTSTPLWAGDGKSQSELTGFRGQILGFPCGGTAAAHDIESRSQDAPYINCLAPRDEPGIALTYRPAW